mmetsp:Transcript_65196/g.121540  ORF Transcript_65196/g.121540 Transcript_65196/m.121540 type:complete len:153 (-) Transcript_65196:36-494(-)
MMASMWLVLVACTWQLSGSTIEVDPSVEVEVDCAYHCSLWEQKREEDTRWTDDYSGDPQCCVEQGADLDYCCEITPGSIAKGTLVFAILGSCILAFCLGMFCCYRLCCPGKENTAAVAPTPGDIGRATSPEQEPTQQFIVQEVAVKRSVVSK